MCKIDVDLRVPVMCVRVIAMHNAAYNVMRGNSILTSHMKVTTHSIDLCMRMYMC